MAGLNFQPLAFASGIVHRAGCGADEPDVGDGPVSQDGHCDSGVAH